LVQTLKNLSKYYWVSETWNPSKFDEQTNLQQRKEITVLQSSTQWNPWFHERMIYWNLIYPTKDFWPSFDVYHPCRTCQLIKILSNYELMLRFSIFTVKFRPRKSVCRVLMRDIMTEKHQKKQN
jgi:hypothetical protein